MQLAHSLVDVGPDAPRECGLVAAGWFPGTGRFRADSGLWFATGSLAALSVEHWLRADLMDGAPAPDETIVLGPCTRSVAGNWVPRRFYSAAMATRFTRDRWQMLRAQAERHRRDIELARLEQERRDWRMNHPASQEDVERLRTENAELRAALEARGGGQPAV